MRYYAPAKLRHFGGQKRCRSHNINKYDKKTDFFSDGQPTKNYQVAKTSVGAAKMWRGVVKLR